RDGSCAAAVVAQLLTTHFSKSGESPIMAEPVRSQADESLSSWLKRNADQVVPWAMLAALIGILLFVYWNSLDSRGAKQFWDNPKYSHGWLVPLFTLVLLWMRYEPFGPVTPRERWAGVALLSGGLGLRLLSTYYPSHVLEMDSFVPAVAG